MQIPDFLHENCIPIRQKFVHHLLQIQSFEEFKIFTCCTKKGNKKKLSILFRGGSRIDEKSKM